MTTAALNRENKAGYRSGLLHDPVDPLCAENIGKMRHATGNPACEPMIYAYWLGYRKALQERGLIDC